MGVYQFGVFDTLTTDALLEKFFKILDANDDGSLDVEELPGLIDPDVGRARKEWHHLQTGIAFSHEDTNKDGSVSLEELIASYKDDEEDAEKSPKHINEMFETIDTNKDKSISLEEMVKYEDEHHHHDPPAKMSKDDIVETELDSIFEHDKDEDGYISLEELKAELFPNGLEWTL